MITQELIDYIKNQLQLGRSEEVIKTMLKNAGWEQNDIEEGFKSLTYQQEKTQQTPSLFAVEQTSQSLTGSKSLFNVSRLIILIFAAVGISIAAGGGYFVHQKYFKSVERLAVQTEQQDKTQHAEILENFKCELKPKKDYNIFSGRVEFPKGIKNSNDYNIVYHSDKYEILNNKFCIYVYMPISVDVVDVIMASVDNDENDFPLLSFFEHKNEKEIVINSRSTAVALIMLDNNSLNFSLNQGIPLGIVLNTLKKIEDNQAVIEFINEINKKENLFPADMEKGGDLEKYYDNAAKSIIFMIELDNSSNSLMNHSRQIVNQQKISSDIYTLEGMIFYYYSDNKIYPQSLDKLVSKYLQKIPINPITNKYYEYSLKEGGQNYFLCAQSDEWRMCADKTREWSFQ